MVADCCLLWLQLTVHSHHLSPPILFVHRPGATGISFFCPTLLCYRGNKWANIITIFFFFFFSSREVSFWDHTHRAQVARTGGLLACGKRGFKLGRRPALFQCPSPRHVAPLCMGNAQCQPVAGVTSSKRDTECSPGPPWAHPNCVTGGNGA